MMEPNRMAYLLDDQQPQYAMNYYPGGIAPGGYAIAAADKPGLYAASPYAAIPSHYAAAGQPGLPPGIPAYAAARQQYAVVSQASPYTSSQHAAAAYYASTGATGYPAAAGVPLSSLQTMSSTTPQSAYLSQYPAGMGVQRAMLGPSSVAAAGYGGSPLYAASTAYTGLPGVPGQPASRSPYAVATVGYTTGGTLPPSASPAFPGATAYGPPY